MSAATHLAYLISSHPLAPAKPILLVRRKLFRIAHTRASVSGSNRAGRNSIAKGPLLLRLVEWWWRPPSAQFSATVAGAAAIGSASEFLSQPRRGAPPHKEEVRNARNTISQQ